MKHYKEHFIGKVIYCNCDYYESSNFYNYFIENFNNLWLKKLITTNIQRNNINAVKTETIINDNWKLVSKIEKLEWNWSFGSDECIELLEECDIVVTNPPFSLFRNFIDLLYKYNKKFLIVWNINMITYYTILKSIKESYLQTWINWIKEFYNKQFDNIKFWNIIWYQNLKKFEKWIELTKSFNNSYKKYDNFDWINIDKIKDIPYDYNWYMWVPITFLTKYNSEQFEIVFNNRNLDWKDLYVDWKTKYLRVIIKNKLL